MDKNIKMKVIVSVLSLLILSMSPGVASTKNWSVRIGDDGIQQRAVCLLESDPRQIHDGQTTTPVKLVYNGKVLIAVTKSNIDLSYAGIGLQVDKQSIHAVDTLHKKTRVVFEKASNDIIQEFIKGREARLVLGFWPSWPKTKTVTSHFSLRGFSRAYQAFQDCQQTGVVKK